MRNTSDRVNPVSTPDDEDMNLTTQQAATLAGMTTGVFRAHASRQRAIGNEMRAPRDEWDDGRTPKWDEDKVKAWVASRKKDDEADTGS